MVSGKIDHTKANTTFGYNAGNWNTGTDNTFIGDSCAHNNNGSARNTCVGSEAAMYLNFGFNNCYFGYQSGFVSANASNNTFMGYKSGVANGGSANTFIGSNSGEDNVGGNNNVFVGYQSGLNNSSGQNNVFIGYDAGATNNSGQSNLCIGTGSDVGSSAVNYSTAIGQNALVSIDNAVVIGAIQGINGAASSAKVGIGTTAPATSLELDGSFCLSDSVMTVSGNFTINPSQQTYFRINSSVVPSSAIVTISAGNAPGQIVVIECASAVATNGFTVADTPVVNNTNVVVARAMNQNDTIMLIWNGTDWLEMSFAAN